MQLLESEVKRWARNVTFQCPYVPRTVTYDPDTMPLTLIRAGSGYAQTSQWAITCPHCECHVYFTSELPEGMSYTEQIMTYHATERGTSPRSFLKLERVR